MIPNSQFQILKVEKNLRAGGFTPTPIVESLRRVLCSYSNIVKRWHKMRPTISFKTPMKTQFHNRCSGFTLLELIVALGMFTVIIFVATSSLLNILDVYRKTDASRAVMDNVNFAFENMTRALLTGLKYHCGPSVSPVRLNKPQDCPSSGDSFIAFVDIQKGGVLSAYRLNGTRIEYSNTCFDTGCQVWEVITAPEIKVNTLRFYVDGSYPTSPPPLAFNDDLQPRVFIVLEGTAGAQEKTDVTFNLQTLVSQRILDL